jgi:phosphonate transport system substrate-binding protein
MNDIGRPDEVAPLTFTVSPDFNVRHLPGWYVVNMWLQRHTGDAVHLQTFDDFGALHKALDEGRIDLIYANAFDAARLVRDHGYIPIARPHARSDEAVVAVNLSNPVHSVEELQPGTRIASTDNPGVHMMGMIMIEPADLGPTNVQVTRCPNFVLVAKALLYDESDIGFFLAETFDEMSSTVRNQLRVLVRSEIYVISHLFLAHPRLAHRAEAIRRSLLRMDSEEKGLAALDDVGIQRWDAVEKEEVEFMIDLMAALTQ